MLYVKVVSIYAVENFWKNVVIMVKLELFVLYFFGTRDLNQTIQLVQWNIIAACSVDSAQSTIKHHYSMKKTWVVILLISVLQQ